MNKVKIISTIGPKTSSKKNIESLVKFGTNILRLNGSHNTLKWHSEVIKRIKSISPFTPILFDVPGKKIRTTEIDNEINYKKNQILIFASFDVKSDLKKILVNKKNFHLFVKKNKIIYADDGTLAFKVLKIGRNKHVHVKALNSGTLKNGKGINIPGIDFGGKILNQKDKKFILFAKKNKVDFIGISFVESLKHVSKFKKAIGKSYTPKIISKIESAKGLKNLKEIIEISDGIMIDRGDLSIETSDHSLAIRQKQIINMGKELCKPVIVATELLNNMILNKFPTRSEVSDIGNAIMDGASALMLSGETAVGDYSFESVETLRKIINSVEKDMHQLDRELTKPKKNLISKFEHSAEAIELICKKTNINKIVAITRTGFAARSLALREFKVPILAVSDIESNAKSFGLYPGVQGVYFKKKFEQKNLDFFKDILKFLYQKNILIITIIF
jgi:pyruvate kinase